MFSLALGLLTWLVDVVIELDLAFHEDLNELINYVVFRDIYVVAVCVWGLLRKIIRNNEVGNDHFYKLYELLSGLTKNQ